MAIDVSSDVRDIDSHVGSEQAEGKGGDQARLEIRSLIRAEVAEVLAPKPRSIEQRVLDLEVMAPTSRAITYDDLYEVGYYALGTLALLFIIAALSRNRF